MGFKIVSGGIKSTGNLLLDRQEPTIPKFKVISGGEKTAPITEPKFKVISEPKPTPQFTGKTIQSIATNSIVSKALDVAAKIMPPSDWEKLQQEQDAIGKAAVDLPGALGNIMAFKGQPKDVSTLGTAALGAIEPLGRIYEPAIRVPLRATAQNIRALVTKGETPPVGVGQLAQETAKAFFQPRSSTPITRTAVPLTKWEKEGSVARLIPRALTEAIESVLVYSPVIGTPEAKTLREGINELITKKSKVNYKQSLEEAKNIITKYKEPGSLAVKAEQLSQEGKIIPLAKGQGQQIENQIRNLWSKQIYQSRLSKTPVKLLAPEELFGAQPKGALLPKLVSEKGSIIMPFKEGDIVNFGKESGKILKLGAEKALLSIGGKEIEAKLSEISPTTPKIPFSGVPAQTEPTITPQEGIEPSVFTGKVKPTEGKVEQYGMQHRPTEGPPAYDLLAKVEGDDFAPKDIYEHPEWYANNDGSLADRQTISAIKKLRGKPDAEVTIYRSAPNNELNNGDWVSFSKAYAKGEGIHPTDSSKDIPVYSFKVKASDVKWAGDSLNEFGYFGKDIKLSTPTEGKVEEYGMQHRPTAGGKPPVEPPPTAISGAPEEPQRSKINIETIRPDQYGKTPISKAIEKMQDRIARVNAAQYALEETENIRKKFIRRITKYKDAYLKEELTGIPSIYITKEGGISPDEAMDELRNMNIEITDEVELKQFLQNLEEQKKSLEIEIRTYKPQFITKKETTLLTDKIKAVAMGFRAGRIKTKEEISNVQTELIGMIEQSGLDLNDRAKFMRLIKNVQTPKQFEGILPEVIERLQALREKAERAEVIADIKDLFKKQPTASLPLDYKDKIEAIKDKFEPRQLSAKTKARVESMREFVNRMKEQGEEINIPEEHLALLEKTTLNDMSIDELRSVYDIIIRLYHQGSLKDKLITSQQNRRFQEVVNEAVNTITQGKGITEETSIVKALRKQNKNLANMTLEGVKAYITIHLRPELMINALDNFTRGVNTQTIWEPMANAENAKLEEADRTLGMIQEINKNIDIGEALGKKYKIGRFEGMTRDNALFIYANSFNDANRAHLYGSGVTDEDLTVIEKFLSEAEKTSVRNQIDFYDKYQWPEIDKVYSELNGVHLGKEDNYFPIDRLEDISYDKELEKNILERAYVRRPGVSKGFTKERVSSKKGFSEFSYFNTIYRNWGKVEHYKAFAKVIRDVNKYLSNPQVKEAIKQKFNDQYYKVLEKWLKDVSYGGDRTYLSAIDAVSRWIRTNYSTSVLGYNLLTMLKQPISWSAGAEMAGKTATLKASAKVLSNPWKWIDFTKQKSVMLRHRGFTQERELREIRSQRGMGLLFGKVEPYQRFKEIGMLPIMAADRVTVTTIWLAAYDDYISKAKSETEAIAWADQVIRRTQPMGGIMHLADVFRGPEYQKLFTLFKNQLNQNFNLTYELYSKFGKGKTSPKDFIEGNIFYILVPAFLIGLVSRKRLPKNIGEFTSDTVSQVFGSLIILGNIFQSLSMKFQGDLTPLEGYSSDIYSMAKGKELSTKLRALGRFTGKVTGLPYPAGERIFKGQPLGRIEEQPKFKFKSKFPSKFKSKFKSKF